MNLLRTLILTVVVLVVGAMGIAYSGLINVAASSPHSRLANWFLSTVSRASVERRAADIEVPDLSSDALVRAGVNDFNAMCAGCHGAPGKAPDAVGKGLNPPAPDLSESAATLTPAELFWITKHGIRMTGMPAWGHTHEDEALWPVVALMTRLPELDGNEYESLVASAAGMGHHADGADHGDHSHDASESAPAAEEEHDHGSHSHASDESLPESKLQEDGHDHEH